MMTTSVAHLPAHIDIYTLTDEQLAIVDAARARKNIVVQAGACLLYTSDAADE